MNKKAPKSNFRKKFSLWYWILFSLGILSIALIFTLISIGKLGYLPPIDELQNPINKYATEIYSSDLQVLGSFSRSNENRVKVNYSQISPNVINALIATEDVRFYEHSGIDGKALVRAIVLSVFLHHSSSGGGSTITQQLAKQLYSPEADNKLERFIQKPIEWVISVKLEKMYSKHEIITMYLNKFDFLYNAVGIKSAAQIYFNTTPAELTIDQAATLVGMCKNPAYFNPVRHNERTRERRNVVLNQMRKAHYITQQQFDSLKTLPLVLDFHRAGHKDGLAPYFREYLRQLLTAKNPDKSKYAKWQKQQYLDDKYEWDNNPLYGFCNKNKKPDGSPYNIYTDGLKIYTTIDSRMQTYAEEAVREHLKELQAVFFKEKESDPNAPFSKDLTPDQIESIMNNAMHQTDRYRRMRAAGISDDSITKVFNTPIDMQVFSYDGTIDTTMSPIDSIRYLKYFLRCGFMSMDAKSGQVKAYIGGPDFSEFQYDMATLGRRQVGSTIKPYLYTLAMEEGMWPCDKTVWQPTTLIDGNGDPWTPNTTTKNVNLGDVVTLRWGLTNSDNWISAYLMSLFTPDALVKLMRSFGIRGPIDPVVSLCLGICDVSVEEMVDAYTAFPNKGIRVDPIYVTRIEDSNGNVIATFTPKTHEIFSETTAYKMINMMENVVNNGTGVRIRWKYRMKLEMGGKTGTTQNNSDGWFMGYTPSLVSGVWVGGVDRSIHFDELSLGQGANMALPIWALYMKKVLADPDLGYSSDEKFDIPKSFDPNAGCKGNKSNE